MTKSTPNTFKFSWSSQQSHILEGLKSLSVGEGEFSNVFLTDVTLACEGEYIEAHRLVLSLCSSFFKDLFNRNERISEKANGIVILGNVSAIDLRHLLQFMYQGSVHIPKEHVDGFLQAGSMLKVEGLMSTTGVAIGLSDKTSRVTTPSTSSAKPCPKSKKRSSPSAKRNKRRRTSSSVSGSDDDNEACGRVGVNVKFEQSIQEVIDDPFDDNEDPAGLEEAEVVLDDFGDTGGDSDVGGVDVSGDENEGAALDPPESIANRLENLKTVTPKRDAGSVVRAGGRQRGNNQQQHWTPTGEPGIISLSGIGESERRLSLRHPIWTLFSFDFRTNTSCCLITGCGTTLSGKFTTNLKKHLRCHHPHEFRTFIEQYKNTD